MTYSCARCHTHKFDPILHTEYYRLQAFFANTAAGDELLLLSPDKRSEYRARKAVWEEKTKPIRDQIAALLTNGRCTTRRSRTSQSTTRARPAH